MLPLVANAIFLICLTLRSSQVVGTKVVEYGEKCGIAAPACNPKSFLQCVNRVCLCSLGSFYDEESKACIAEIGGVCQGNLVGLGRRNISLSCPAHATCVETDPSSATSLLRFLNKNKSRPLQLSKTCKCDDGYKSKPTRHGCVPTLAYGKSCSKSDKVKCDDRQGFVCGPEGTCACPVAGPNIYDKKLLKCVTGLGKVCVENQCQTGTVCSVTLLRLRRTWYPYDVSAKQEQLRNELPRCVCLPGTIPDGKGTCVGNFRAACSNDKPCNADSFLHCINGQCACAHGTTEVFDGTCQLTMGSTCKTKGPPCQGNATCTDGRCQLKCGDGLSPSPIGTCMKTHTSKCDLTTRDFCNNFEGLGCIHGNCTCFDSSLDWDKKVKMCVAKNSGKCGKFKTLDADVAGVSTSDDFYDLGSAGIDHYLVGCGDGMVCQPDVVTGNNTCVKH